MHTFNSLHNYHTETARSLCYAQTPVDASMALIEVSTIFNQHPSITSLPVIRDNKPIGLINKWKILELFSQHFGRALYEKKLVSEFMYQSPLIVEETTQIQEVSRLMTMEDEVNIRQHFIITHDGEYLGMGRTRDLLKRITEQQIQHARHANPLTHIPGNIPLKQQMKEVLLQKQDFSLVYFDINHFKPFNDIYGYDRGDKVICELGKILTQHGRSQQNNTQIFHIGGDDFVALTPSNYAKKLSLIAITEFNKICAKFVDQADLYQGHYLAVDRDGRERRFDFPTLSAGIVTDVFIRKRTANEIAVIAASAKKLAKQMPMAPHIYTYDSVCDVSVPIQSPSDS